MKKRSNIKDTNPRESDKFCWDSEDFIIFKDRGEAEEFGEKHGRKTNWIDEAPNDEQRQSY